MAKIDPSDFYKPTAYPDPSLSSSVVPPWFANVEPVTFEDAMKTVNALQQQAQQEEMSTALLEQKQREVEGERAVEELYKKKKQKDEQKEPWDDFPEAVKDTLMQYGQSNEAIQLERNRLAREKQQQGQIKTLPSKSGIMRVNSDGSVDILSQPKESKKEAQRKLAVLQDPLLPGKAIIDPLTGEPIVYDPYDQASIIQAYARASMPGNAAAAASPNKPEGKPKPPKPLPGETREQYKKRVRGG